METDGFQGRQRDESSSPAEKVTAIEFCVHGRFQNSRLDQFMNGHGKGKTENGALGVVLL
jgi:hypothetical protein